MRSFLPTLRLVAVCIALMGVGRVLHGQSPSPQWDGKSPRQWAEQLTDTDIRVRWYATYALGQIGPPAAGDAAGPLSKMLENRSEQEYVRGNAAWAIGRIRPSDKASQQLLIDTLASKHVSVRRNSSEALGNLGEKILGDRAKGAVPALVERLGDEDAVVRVNAAVALWKIDKSEKSLLALAEMVRKGPPAVAFQAAEALGELKPEPVLAAATLTEAFGNSDADVRRAAARALGQIGRPAFPAIKKALADPSEETRRLAVESLGWMGEAAVPQLAFSLKNDRPAARRAAAIALARLGVAARSAEAALVRAVDDADPAVRDAAAKALRKIRAE